MTLRHLILTAFSCGIMQGSVAQVIRLNDQCNPLINSIAGVAYVVRQDYALKGKDGVLYGQNNQTFFGFRYGAGIIWNNQLYISPVTYFAHLRDSLIAGYGNDYTPTPTQSSFKHLTDYSFRPIAPSDISSNPEKAMAFIADSLSGIQPKDIPPNASRKTLVVVFECRDNELSDTSKYKLNFLYSTVVRDANGTLRLKDNNWGSQARFALVFDEITEVGVAKMEFRGFAEPVGDKLLLSLVTVEEIPTVKDKPKPKRK